MIAFMLQFHFISIISFSRSLFFSPLFLFYFFFCQIRFLLYIFLVQDWSHSNWKYSRKSGKRKKEKSTKTLKQTWNVFLKLRVFFFRCRCGCHCISSRFTMKNHQFLCGYQSFKSIEPEKKETDIFKLDFFSHWQHFVLCNEFEIVDLEQMRTYKTKGTPSLSFSVSVFFFLLLNNEFYIVLFLFVFTICVSEP